MLSPFVHFDNLESLYFSVPSLLKNFLNTCFYRCFDFCRVYNRNIVQVTNIKRNRSTFI